MNKYLDCLTMTEEIFRSNEENKRLNVLDAVQEPEFHLYTADMHRLSLSKEDIHPEQQEWKLSQEQDSKPPKIKEEQDKLWISGEAEQIYQMDEIDFVKPPFTVVPVKIESDAENLVSPQLYHSHTRDGIEAELVASNTFKYITLKIDADVEDYGGSQTASNSDQCHPLHADTDGRSTDCSETETDDSCKWKQTRQHHSGLNCQSNSDICESGNSCSIAKKQFTHAEYEKTFVYKEHNRTLAINKIIEQDHLKRNITTHTGKKSFGCSDCGKRFTKNSILNKHIRIHTGEKPYECLECGKTFREKGHLNRHTKIHTGEKPFGCLACGKRFREKDQLKIHKRIHTGDKPFGCSECEKRFIKKIDLIKHVRCHTGEKPYICSHCDKRFREKPKLNAHMRIHTGAKPFGCSDCGERFRVECTLHNHMRIHTGEKPFVCCECGKRFRVKSSLVKHSRIHTGEKPFVCSECGKRFTQKGNLNQHMIIHTGEKPFGCPECGKRFTQKGRLKRHNRIHTGDKPFVCLECGKRFRVKSGLNKHNRIHLREKPFVCSECGKNFTQKAGLNLHMMIHIDEKYTQQLLVNKEDIVPEQQERNLSLDQEDSKPPNVKQEHEKPWTSWEEKQPSLLKEADFTKFHFTAVPVKIENNDENLDSLQFYQSKTDYSAEAEPVACNSTDHRILKMEAGIEDCEELQPARISDPYLHLQIDTDDRSSDSSEPETDDSYEGNQTEEPHSGLNCLTNDDAVYIHNSKFHQIHVEQEYPSGLKRTVPLNSSQCRGCMIERHGDRPERSGSKVRQVNQHLRRSYDANFKLMVINAAESSNNYQAAKKYGVTECNIRRWRTQKDCLKNSNSQRKAYRGPKNGRFQEIDRKVWQYVVDKRNEGLPITRAAIRLKALEIAEELNIPTSEFKASLSWCRRMMRRKGISLRSRSHLDMQQLPVSDIVPKQQKGNLNLHPEDSKPPNIKEEQEEVWIQEEGNQPHNLEGVDITKFLFGVDSKSEEKPQTDGQCYGGPHPAHNIHPYHDLQQDNYDRHSDSSETETDDSYDWKQAREPHLDLNCLKSSEVSGTDQCQIAKKEVNCCDYGIKFDHMSCSNQNKQIDASEKRYRCSECGKKFGHKSNLNRHMRSHTGDKLFGCSECGQKFGQKDYLSIHMRIHTGEKPFGCPECGESFRQQSHLNIHMRLHTGEKPFVCSICGKCFRQKSHLNLHTRLHTGDKPFGCSVCGVRYGRKDELDKHRRSHTGEKPFGCSECGQKFPEKATLNRHTRIHTGEKPFCCSECGKIFGHKCNLKHHMKIHIRLSASDLAPGSSQT
ncbi:uncharacterized protein LOC117504513 [Thalassophryne amazonica]|uniref:uncharacterized protein LOC117504513 n=1 Tax=Thalassophryne amazonica TaxID=390379 RepID=UPI001472673C|nr:uncharacterized protein LOC117504513 [Thalassophryne amazonica]